MWSGVMLPFFTFPPSPRIAGAPFLKSSNWPDQVSCPQFCWAGLDDLSHRGSRSGYEWVQFLSFTHGTWKPFSQYTSTKSLQEEKEEEGKEGGEEGEERDKRRAPLSARQSLRFYGGKALVMNEKFSVIIQILENSSNQIDQERLGDLVIIGILFYFIFLFMVNL